MLCIWLNVAGALLEISGFSLVAYELFRTQRREFGDPKLVALLKRKRNQFTGFVRRLFGKTKVISVGADLAASYGIEGTAKGQLRRGRGQTLEDHVAALELNFAELDREIEEHRTELDKAIGDVQSELHETKAELERQSQERKEEEQEILRGSVTLQSWGICLFVAGVLANFAANVISCS